MPVSSAQAGQWLSQQGPAGDAVFGRSGGSRRARPSYLVGGFAVERVSEPAHAIPPVTVGLELEVVHAAVVGDGLVLVDQVGESLALVDVELQSHLAGCVSQVVHTEKASVAPLVEHREDFRPIRADEFPVAPADLGAFLSQTDHAD